MEINLFNQIIGVVTQADVVEGRFVILVNNDADAGALFMNVNDDLPGARVPATAEEATRAKYCVTFAVDNRPAPIVNYPKTVYDFRGGWVNSNSGPLSVTMYLTHPGNQEGLTIASGTPALGVTEATVTLPSGAYVYDANIIVPGAQLIVADTATDGAADAGKPKYTATKTVGVIGETEDYDSTTGKLTIRIRD